MFRTEDQKPRSAGLSSGPGFSFITGPSIERNSITPTVVFKGDWASGNGEGIYVGTGGPLLPIVQGSIALNNGGINDCGVVAYTMGSNDSIWKGDGTNSLMIDSIGGNIIGLGSSAGINDDAFGPGILSGTVSYLRVTPSTYQIELDSNLAKSTLATSCNAGNLNAQYPPINNAGTVAYSAIIPGGPNLCTKTLTTTENLIASGPGVTDYAVNIEGIVAFDAATGGPDSGIYTGSNLVTDKVVATGDVMPDGSTVTYVALGGMNDNCQISFLVNFVKGGNTGHAAWRANATNCSLTPANTVGIPFRYGDVFASVGYDSQGNSGVAKEFRPNGALLAELIDGTTPFPETAGTAFDAAGNFYVVNYGGETVSKFNASGQLVATTFIDGAAHNQRPISIRPVGTKVDLSDLKLYTGGSSNNAATPSPVIEWDKNGNYVRTINVSAVPSLYANGGVAYIDFLSADTLVYSTASTAIKAYDISLNKQLPDIIHNLPGPEAVQIRVVHRSDYCRTPACTLPDPYILVADYNQVLLIDVSPWPGMPGKIVKTYSMAGTVQNIAVAVDPDGRGFWVGDDEHNFSKPNNVYHVDPCTGKIDRSWIIPQPATLQSLAIWGGLAHVW